MNWTKVTDALPSDGERVMVTMFDTARNRKFVAVCVYMVGFWFDVFGGGIMDESYLIVTHWTEVPAPAEDGEG